MERAARELLAEPERPTGIVALWQTASWGLARAARSLGLQPGRDFEMVGWANEEDYEETFRSLFEPGRLPAAVVWPVAAMAETALARLEERRANPELPTIHLRIPTRLRPGTENTRSSGR
jgi:DNA-binding LacI/PurR family transcriptional regulator